LYSDSSSKSEDNQQNKEKRQAHSPPANKQTGIQRTTTSQKHSLRIGAWNVHSLSKVEKVKEILDRNLDIVLLQEIWNPKADIINLFSDWKCYWKYRGDNYGGSAILLNDQTTTVKEPIEINKDSQLIKVNFGGDRCFWLASIYLDGWKKKALLDTMAKIQDIVPQNEWQYLIIGGDWNINLKNKENKINQTLQILIKQMKLQVSKCNWQRRDREIDFFIYGDQIKIHQDGN
jgi:hypothetical protein